MTGKKLVQTNVSLVLFNWLRSNDAKASITSTAVALGDLPKPLTNYVRKVLSTFLTPCRNSSICPNDAKASITSTAVALGDLPKPLTNYVRKVLSTFLTPCRNSSICPNDAKASIISWAIALGDLPKLLTNSFVTLLNLFKLIITGRTLVGSTGLSRYL